MNTKRLFALALFVFSGACGQKGEPEPAPDATVATQDRELVELTLPGPMLAGASPFASGGDAIAELESEVRALVDDRRAVGLFLRVGPLPGAWVKTADLGIALDALRAAHKPVHCHVDVVDGVAYRLLASHCDRLTMTPAGHLSLTGASLQVFFVRSLLESIGVRAEVLHVGRYKGTGDSLTMDTMPDTMRESLGGIVTELDGALLRAVSEQTGLDRNGAAALIDRGPFDGELALASRLVDALEFDDAARAHAKSATRAARVRSAASEAATPPTLRELFEQVTRASERVQARGEGARLAVVNLEGPIVDGERMLPGQIRSEVTVAHLRALADDADVKAVVLRIDSPGGSVIASDRIWHAVRRLASRKPVIASIGGMGASGGYYIAAAATEVFALEESLVGSIGVVSGKADASGLLARLGVTPITLSQRAHAGISTLTRAWTEDERATLQTSMNHAYERFIDRIAAGRGLDEARIRQAAEGRIWTGRAAHELGLVTTLGGREAALARARALGHLPADPNVETWPRREGLIERIVALFMGEDGASASVIEHVIRAFGPELALLGAFVTSLETSPLLVALPYVLEVR
jgi:protease-4